MKITILSYQVYKKIDKDVFFLGGSSDLISFTFCKNSIASEYVKFLCIYNVVP